MTNRSHPIKGFAQRRGCKQCTNPNLKGIHTCGKDRKPGIDWEAERKEFEAWYLSEWGYRIRSSLNRIGHDGPYEEYGAKVAWSTWQKARNTIPKVSFR